MNCLVKEYGDGYTLKKRTPRMATQTGIREEIIVIASSSLLGLILPSLRGGAGSLSDNHKSG